MFGAFRQYICDGCKGKFRFKEIRYSSDGKRVVCKDCYSKGAMKNQKKKETSEVLPNKNISDSVKLICMNCRYKFSLRKKSRFSLICPYCGGKQLMKDDITADKLIEEVSQAKKYQ